MIWYHLIFSVLWASLATAVICLGAAPLGAAYAVIAVLRVWYAHREIERTVNRDG